MEDLRKVLIGRLSEEQQKALHQTLTKDFINDFISGLDEMNSDFGRGSKTLTKAQFDGRVYTIAVLVENSEKSKEENEAEMALLTDDEVFTGFVKGWHEAKTTKGQ